MTQMVRASGLPSVARAKDGNAPAFALVLRRAGRNPALIQCDSIYKTDGFL